MHSLYNIEQQIPESLLLQTASAAPQSYQTKPVSYGNQSSLSNSTISIGDESSVRSVCSVTSNNNQTNHFDYLKLIEPEFQNKIGNCVFYVLEKRYHSRKYLCKFVLNALNNYFLEDFGSVGLKEKMGLNTLKQVKKNILQKVKLCKKAMPQYMKVLNQYLTEHVTFGTLSIYQRILRNIIYDNKNFLNFDISEISQNIDIKNKNQIKSIMKQGIALLLLQHSYYPQFKNINEIWNSLFTESSLHIPSKRVKATSANPRATAARNLSKPKQQSLLLQQQQQKPQEKKSIDENQNLRSETPITNNIQFHDNHNVVQQELHQFKNTNCPEYRQSMNYNNYVNSNGYFIFMEQQSFPEIHENRQPYSCQYEYPIHAPLNDSNRTHHHYQQTNIHEVEPNYFDQGIISENYHLQYQLNEQEINKENNLTDQSEQIVDQNIYISCTQVSSGSISSYNSYDSESNYSEIHESENNNQQEQQPILELNLF